MIYEAVIIEKSLGFLESYRGFLYLYEHSTTTSITQKLVYWIKMRLDLNQPRQVISIMLNATLLWIARVCQLIAHVIFLCRYEFNLTPLGYVSQGVQC